jgi:hypothetical protein
VKDAEKCGSNAQNTMQMPCDAIMCLGNNANANAKIDLQYHPSFYL